MLNKCSYHSTRLPSQNTTLTRFLTGSFNLNYYLHKSIAQTQCGFNNETIAHFLLYCPMYRAQRRVLHNNITKIAGRSASPLNLDVLLDQPKCTSSNLAFVDAVKLKIVMRVDRKEMNDTKERMKNANFHCIKWCWPFVTTRDHLFKASGLITCSLCL
jgi:hypothetical protein